VAQNDNGRNFLLPMSKQQRYYPPTVVGAAVDFINKNRINK
jgi:hypothetical protein